MSLAANKRALLFVAVALVGAIAPCPAHPQPIIPDGDGTRTIVMPNGQHFDISGGQLSRDGANLFHSFQQFGLNRTQIANFLSQPSIRNILGRVVGGDVSIINGLIQVTGGQSNLFLMNPAGIVFGPDASFNLPADFTATTATGIRLGDAWFNAVGPNDYQALVGTPNAFAFATTQPGVVLNAGTLTLNPNRHLALIGGTAINTGTLSVPGGQITLAAIPGESIVRISQPGHVLSLDVQPLTLADGQPGNWTVPIADLPALLTSDVGHHATGVTLNDRGQVMLTGSGMTLVPETGDTIVSGTLNTSTLTTGQQGGNVLALGQRVALTNATIDVSGSNGGGRALVGGDYQGQGTLPTASHTAIDNNSSIRADAFQTGNGGQVIVWADEVTEFSGSISARGGADAGDGGFIEVSGKGTLQFSGIADTSATAGKSGTLLLDPKDLVVQAGGPNPLPGHSLFSDNAAGTSIISGANLSAAINSGNVTLQANNDITINDNIAGTTAGNGLTLQAGRSIIFNATRILSLNNGDFTATINDENAIAANRDAGTAEFRMHAGSQILTQGGDVTIQPGTFGGAAVGQIHLSSATLNAGGGNISLTGIGAAVGDNNRGIEINQGSQVQSSGTGNITLNGTGGAGNDFNAGIRIIDAGSQITSVDGDITLIGTSHGTGNENDGILITNGGTIESTGQGSISLTGTSGIGMNANGVQLSAIGSSVRSVEGNIVVNGTSSGTVGSLNQGLEFFSDAGVESTRGDIALTGTGSNGAEGIRFHNVSINSTAGSGNGDIVFTADELLIFGTSTIEGSGTIQLQPLNPTLDITIGGTLNDARLNLSDTELATLQDGFSQIVIGSETGSGTITLAGNTTFGDPLSIQTPNGAGSIDTTGFTLSGTDDATLTLRANQDIRTANINTSGQAVTLVSTNGRVNTTAGTLDTASLGGGGDITLSGPRQVRTGPINAGTGDIRLTSNTIVPGGILQGQGQLILAPTDPGKDITIANPFPTPALDLETFDLDLFQDGFSSIVIGRADGTGIITLNPYTFRDPVRIAGGSTLIGANQNTTWTIAGSDTGRLNGFGETVTFANIENLVGGSADDTFRFNGSTARISGNIDGVGVTDTLDYFAYTGGPIDVVLGRATPGTATGVGGTILSIENIIFPAPVPPFLPPASVPPAPASPAPIPSSPQREPREPILPDDIITALDSPQTSLTNRLRAFRYAEEQVLEVSIENIETLLNAGHIQTALSFLDLTFSNEFALHLGRPPLQSPLVFANLQNKLRDAAIAAGNRPAVIYTLARPDGLHLILVPPEGPPIHRSIPNARREILLQSVGEFHYHIGDITRRRTTSYMASAQQLYQWLVEPLTTDLQTLDIKTLIFALDSGLRRLPLAALHDGQQFLVEQYHLSLIPSLYLTNTHYNSLKPQNTNILAMGMSEQFPDNQKPLPAVPVELSTIAERLWDGETFLNGEFTLQNLKKQRRDRPFNIVHLASHGRFQSNNTDRSYIQLWDKKLALPSMAQLKWDDPPVELLVLSACQTAVGNQKVELGFAGLAVQTGVKSALASLWYVNDTATLGLMTGFYDRLRQSSIKVEALQQVQIAMLRGEVQVKAGRLSGAISEDILLPLELANLGNRAFTHPYYWAGFTMVGNPW